MFTTPHTHPVPNPSPGAYSASSFSFPAPFFSSAACVLAARTKPLSMHSALPRCTAVATAPIKWRVMAALVHVPALHRSPSSLITRTSSSASLAVVGITSHSHGRAAIRVDLPKPLLCLCILLPVTIHITATAVRSGRNEKRLLESVRTQDSSFALSNSTLRSYINHLADVRSRHCIIQTLAIVRNQPAANAAAQCHSQASDIACILRETKQQYRVRYTQPEADPALTYVSKPWLEKSAAHIHVVQAWCERQRQQEQQHLADAMDNPADPNNCYSTSDDE